MYEQNFRRPERIRSEEPEAQKSFEKERDQRVKSNQEQLERLNNIIAEKRKTHFSNISSINTVLDNSNVEQQLPSDKQAIQQCVSRMQELQSNKKQNSPLQNKTITNNRLKAILDESRQNKSRIDICHRAGVVRAESASRASKQSSGVIERARRTAEKFIRESVLRTKRTLERLKQDRRTEKKVEKPMHGMRKRKTDNGNRRTDSFDF